MQYCLPLQGVSEELLRDIDREATRRMTALVAPQARDAHSPAVLRLSMGPLFEEASLLLKPVLISRVCGLLDAEICSNVQASEAHGHSMLHLRMGRLIVSLLSFPG
jgi:hypothetical protein